MGLYKRGGMYWYKFRWNGKLIRESTKQGNKDVARQIEAAHRVSLAKGEVGIREKKAVPTLREFAENAFLPFVRSTFKAKPKTGKYYEYGVKALLSLEELADTPLDAITTDRIGCYVARRQAAKGSHGQHLQVSSINRELQALRRMFTLAQEWGKVDKVLPRVRMMPGERHRERVLTSREEDQYLGNAEPLLRAVATILLDCGLRPEETFRMKWPDIRDGLIEVQYGKTPNARRRVPMSPRVRAILEMRRSAATASEWVFPAETCSGHIEPASVKRQHLKACKGKAEDNRKTGEKRFEVEPFPLYTLRHTCLTHWAPYMDPWTLAYLAGHRDMTITKRYVHPQADTILAAVERAQAGHKIGHSDATSLQLTEAQGGLSH